MKESYFFCGIGGSGMSSLASIMLARGCRVRGSDRGHDRGESPEKFAALAGQGIELFPQDGSGIVPGLTALVVSSAVEPTVPDVKTALEKNIPVRKRAEILAGLVNAARGICIGGTSGKTTVTGMTGHMLAACGLDPTIMNGGHMLNFLNAEGQGNAVVGKSGLFVTETDESDGSISLFTPAVAVLNNITLDHKPLPELRTLFTGFLERAREAVIVNIDDPETAQLAKIHKNTITFSYDNPQATLTASALAHPLQVPGRHNVMNALAALGVAKALGLDLEKASAALSSFRGTRRRFEIIGIANGITVIDDFAHNPDKIEATLNTLHETPGRVIAIFQPHGFGPTRMMKDGLIETFANYLGEQDMLIMPEIYYAGGTAEKTISSSDITEAVTARNRNALFIEGRAGICDYLARTARPGDRVVIMGARDDTLPDFARRILESITEKAA